MNPKISVIVPTYNEEKFIGKCLKALNTQTLPRDEYEIIVSDSSSTDRTVKIAKKFIGGGTLFFNQQREPFY